MASAYYISNWFKNISIENNFNLPHRSICDDLVVKGPLSASKIAWITSNDFLEISERPEAFKSACLSMMMIESSLGKFLD